MKPFPLTWVAAAGGAAAVLVLVGILVFRSGSPAADEADLPDAPPESREVTLPDGVFLVKRNGGWSWFQDERVIVDGDRALVGTVAGATRDGAKAGDVEVTSFDIAKKTSASTTMHAKLREQDLASPSIVRLADGRYLTAYTAAGKDGAMRFRVSEKPGDATKWKGETKLELEGNVAYTNLALDPGGRVLDFYRGGDGLPHVMTSPSGEEFSAGPALFTWTRQSPSFDEKKSTRPGDPRPYVRYASRGGVVHLIATEDHPRSYDTSVFHGYIKGQALHDSAGNVLDADILAGQPIELTKLTRVFEGGRASVPWVVDVDVDAEGRPFLVFVVQKDGKDRADKKKPGGDDHRVHFARWDGQAWTESEVAHAGRRLYKQEANFTGLVALVPKNPDLMFLASNVDPTTGKKGDDDQRFELFRGTTADRGKTWSWTAVTKGSDVDNIRPVVPEWSGGTLVMWLRGSYKSIGSFDLDVVGTIDGPASAAPAGSGAPSASASAAPSSAKSAAPAGKPSAAPAPSAKP